MNNEKAGGYISEIKFNNGMTLEIEQNDIVVFVGSNNVGKSQALKDVYNLSNDSMKTVVISELKTVKHNGSIVALLNEIATREERQNSYQYSFLNNSFVCDKQQGDENFYRQSCFGIYRDIFIANLDTSERLSICEPPRMINRNAKKMHPIHYAAFDPKYRKKLSENFKKAFGIEVTPNIQNGETIPLCMGRPVKFNNEQEKEFSDEQERTEAYGDILDSYEQVQNQGDGIKSFTGVLLYLMLDYYCVFLIDEPEAFLHPPQARIMGQIIGDSLTDQQQAFISTHSEEIIKGLMEACPDRLKVVRITREGNINNFSVLENKIINEIWNDSILKHSNILDSLFHKTVVLCESDSDCKMYSVIESYLKQKAGEYSETLFIHSGGKSRMKTIIKALIALNINIKLIGDIDVLDDKTIFEGIVEAFGIDWDVIQKDYKILVSNLHSSKERIERNTAGDEISKLMNRKNEKYLSKDEIDQIKDIIKVDSKWSSIKSAGVSAIPSGDARMAFDRMNETLLSKGIYIVPVGELENFVRQIGKHGPDWVNGVFEQYPDLDNEVYAEVKDFIEGLNI